MKEAFLTQALELRRRISIATAELDRIKKNKKITERGKRNKAMLEKECCKVSAASLVAYIERKKSEREGRFHLEAETRGNKIIEQQVLCRSRRRL